MLLKKLLPEGGGYALLCVLACIHSSTYAATDLGLSLEVAGRAADERYNQSRLVGASVIGTLHSDLTKNLTGDVRAKIRLDQGSSSATYFDDYGVRQQIRLEEATLTWAPLELFQVKGGALFEDHLGLPVMLSSQTFIGASEEIRFSDYLRIRAQQSLPSTPNGVLPAGAGAQFPAFFWTQAQAVLDNSSVYGDLWVAHYYFYNLPPEVAHPSRFLGNSVTGAVPAQSAFAHRFEGMAFGGTLKLASVPSAPELSLTGLANPSAPQGTAQVARLAATFFPERSFHLRPVVSFFRIEADAVPAFYNRKEWGHTNRIGYEAALNLEFPSDKMTFAASFTQAKPLRSSAFQDDFFYLQLLFVKTYDI